MDDNREVFVNTLKNLDLPTKELLNKYLKAYGESIRISAKQEGRVEGAKAELENILDEIKKEFENLNLKYSREKGIRFKLSCLYIQKIKLYEALKKTNKLIELFEAEKGVN